jgi:S-layer protein
MAMADAVTASGTTAFQSSIDGFEIIRVNGTAAGAAGTVDMANLKNISYVINNQFATAADGVSGSLTVNNLASGGTVELIRNDDATAVPGVTVSVKDASTGTADVLNIVAKVGTTSLNHGTVTAANVETINVTGTDTAPVTSTGLASIQTNTLTLTAAAATNVTIAGNSNVALTLSSSAAVTQVNASALTGALTFTANGATAGTLVTGGAGADTLIASGASDTLNGGAGADVLTGTDLTLLIGGAGADTFNINKPASLNAFSTISDLATGDFIDLDSLDGGTVAFLRAAITLADTAVFQDYANAAMTALGSDTNDAAWFVFNGNTYIVKSGRDHTASGQTDFGNNVDSIIKITGVVNLGNASYNQSLGLLEIGPLGG